MDKLLKCYACGQPATHCFKARYYIISLIDHDPNDFLPICDECNEAVSIKVKTYKLFKVLEGGKNGEK